MQKLHTLKQLGGGHCVVFTLCLQTQPLLDLQTQVAFALLVDAYEIISDSGFPVANFFYLCLLCM